MSPSFRLVKRKKLKLVPTAWRTTKLFNTPLLLSDKLTVVAPKTSILATAPEFFSCQAFCLYVFFLRLETLFSGPEWNGNRLWSKKRKEWTRTFWGQVAKKRRRTRKRRSIKRKSQVKTRTTRLTRFDYSY